MFVQSSKYPNTLNDFNTDNQNDASKISAVDAVKNVKENNIVKKKK